MSYHKIVSPDLHLSQDHDYGGIQLLSNSFLSAVAKGEVDIKALLEYELAARGYDADGIRALRVPFRTAIPCGGSECGKRKTLYMPAQ